MLLRIFKDLGESLLESEDGCTIKQFRAYLSLLKFFEYESLSDSISANTDFFGKRYKCKAGTVSAIFNKH